MLQLLVDGRAFTAEGVRQTLHRARERFAGDDRVRPASSTSALKGIRLSAPSGERKICRGSPKSLRSAILCFGHYRTDGFATQAARAKRELDAGPRQLRESLIELGVALTGDAGRAEVAFDRAFALI